MSFTKTLAAGDILEIDASKVTIRMLDASAGTESNEKANASSGDYPYLDPEDAVVYLSADGASTLIQQVRAVYRKHYL